MTQLQPTSMQAPAAEAPVGLNSAEAARRLVEVGPNQLEAGGRFHVLRAGLAFSSNPLVVILLVASPISGLLGEALNAALIALMVVLSVALNFAQVFRSEQTARQLQRLVAPTARVWRDGRLLDIPVRDIVPGDVLDLRAGDRLPADAELRTATTLSLDEAALTGESLPVEKSSGHGQAARLLAGTSVVSGVGQAVVTTTGGRTQFGAIARALVEKAPPTEYERGARGFGFVIVRTVIGLLLLVFLIQALQRRDPLESLLFALALAVGLTPEFLPMIMTVTLGQGARRMAPGQVTVKRLEAIENLGNMDVLCSDKTGTLTRGSITLQRHVDAWGAESEESLSLGMRQQRAPGWHPQPARRGHPGPRPPGDRQLYESGRAALRFRAAPGQRVDRRARRAADHHQGCARRDLAASVFAQAFPSGGLVAAYISDAGTISRTGPRRRGLIPTSTAVALSANQ
jgi:P-type Mg2+ transporter